MAAWDHGYVSDIAYTTGFYRETMPTWLSFAAAILAHRPPDLARPYRYADLGCGNGIGVLVAAATAPHAEFWGFDFSPTHIEFARNLAEKAGLTNVRFVEAGFSDIAGAPESTYPPFDFIVTHGVISWVTQGDAAALFQIFGNRLRPGGLAYLSYNTPTGWFGMAELRVLMRLLRSKSTKRSDIAIGGILDYLDRLKNEGAAIFQLIPGLGDRLTEFRKQDLRYVSHELLNANWRGMMFEDVAGPMADMKCNYIGSATLLENVDGLCMAPGVAAMVAEADDTDMREVLRDLGTGRSFRRDMYRRGLAPLSMAEHQDVLETIEVAAVGSALPADMSFSGPRGKIAPNGTLHKDIFEAVAAAPISLAKLHRQVAKQNESVPQVMEAVATLVDNALVHPVAPGGLSAEAIAASAGLNRATSAANASGAAVTAWAVPGVGTAVGMDLLTMGAAGALSKDPKMSRDDCAQIVLKDLERTGRAVLRDGQPVPDRKAAMDVLKESIRALLNDRMPPLRRLGGFGA